jgi:hypothetical protein
VLGHLLALKIEAAAGYNAMVGNARLAELSRTGDSALPEVVIKL